MPRPLSGRATSSTWTRAQVPCAASPARTRPQPLTRRDCSSGDSRTYAGCCTWATAVRVPACGSCTIAAPEMSSTWNRSAAASPGRASVPEGRGAAGREWKLSCPTRCLAPKWAAVGRVSIAGLPPQGTKTSASKLTHSGPVTAMPTVPPTKIAGVAIVTANAIQKNREAEKPSRSPRFCRRPNRTVGVATTWS